jgi:hypothetical protein
MSQPASRLPVAISLLALAVSLASLLTTWHLATGARKVEFILQKYQQIERIERAILEHDKMLEEWENCMRHNPENSEVRAVHQKLLAWGQQQRDILDGFKSIKEESGVEARRQLTEWSTMFNTSTTEEGIRENRELFRKYCEPA